MPKTVLQVAQEAGRDSVSDEMTGWSRLDLNQFLYSLMTDGHPQFAESQLYAMETGSVHRSSRASRVQRPPLHPRGSRRNTGRIYLHSEQALGWAQISTFQIRQGMAQTTLYGTSYRIIALRRIHYPWSPVLRRQGYFGLVFEVKKPIPTVLSIGNAFKRKWTSKAIGTMTPLDQF